MRLQKSTFWRRDLSRSALFVSGKHTGLIFCMPGIVFVTGFSPGGLKIVRDDMIR
ncbi:hypothetical protein H9X90_09900 [Faecalicatena contorta]|uniref:hypothetical protein n=1 Tax=Clostridia TaxID=186801 RepID=UPI00189F5148|nr:MULTISPECIES: hypothetical protein [Clostridia]MBM6711046.1 hypothetical protein [Faecalicatena contorta]